MNYISSSCKDRLDSICNILAGEKERNAPDEYLHVFLNLVKKTGLPLTLKEYGIHESDLAGLAEDAIKQKRLLARSPKKLDQDDIYQIYQMAHSGM